MNIEVTCPYCGFKQVRNLSSEPVQLIICDSDEGGCDKTFVARVSIRAVAVSAKIEGEE
jgi:hypothetical protein